jgi:hypothetical protein
MKLFPELKQQAEAIAHAAAGGQALMLLPRAFAHMQARTPAVFRRERWSHIGKIFDQDRTRLAETARRLGVRVVLVDREGQPSQHIDLCGQPLQRGMWEAAGGQMALELPLFAPACGAAPMDFKQQFLGTWPPSRARCPHDTDGDGDCDRCARSGRCEMKREGRP